MTRTIATLREDPTLRVGLAQFKPAKADVSANIDRVMAQIASVADTVDLLVFPEAVLSGYFLEGGVQEIALEAEEVARRLGAPPEEGPDVILGFYERWRGRLYNAAVYLTPGDGAWDIVHVHRKIFLPTYGVFDEERFVESGTEVRAFDTRFGRMGMLVCEDAWHSMTGTALAVGGAELIAVVSATPARGIAPSEGRPNNLDRWQRIMQVMAVEHGVFVVISHLVGSEGGKLFAGDSLAVGPAGDVIARAPLFEEGVTTVSCDPGQIVRARASSPLLSDLEKVLPHLGREVDVALDLGRGRTRSGSSMAPAWSPPAFKGRGAGATGLGGAGLPDPNDSSVLDIDPVLVERALVEFLRDELMVRRGFDSVVLGASGGVDSSVSLMLAARALGPEKVTAFRLPYETSSADSLEHADAVIQLAGVESRTIEITSMVNGYVDAHEPDLSPLRRGNACARARAVILFDQAARSRSLPLGTGNKSERLLGYYTWHADDSPPINPIGDLFKTQVWALARHLGVPSEIVEKPASADLVEGVHDEDELGVGYGHADLILHWLLLGHSPAQLIGRGFAQTHVERVWTRLSSTHWKRRLPTVAMLSSTAIGESYLRPVDY
jgi:NAD+ synthase (glutamine-hydrolysing)